MDKKALRRQMLEKRNSLPSGFRREASIKIQKRFLADFSSFERYALYYAYASEVETTELAQKLLTQGKKVLFPRTEGNIIGFYEVNNLSEMKPGFMGILEPLGQVKTEPEVVVMPGLAFDRTGHRLGYGKGCYDRYLEGADFLKIGFCYSIQLVESVYAQMHDIPLDAVITEKGIITPD